MYHVEAFIAQERWEQQGGTYDSPVTAAEAALAISRERQVSTRVCDEIMGWTRFEHLPGGIQLWRAYNRAWPEIHRVVKEWKYTRLTTITPIEVDLLVQDILGHVTQELQEHT